MREGWCLGRRSTEEDSAWLALKQSELKDLLDPIFSEKTRIEMGGGTSG